MQQIIVFTDLHLGVPGARIIGLDMAERFAAGLARAIEAHPNAARIVITGDLTHHGAPEEYAVLARLLRDCPLPVSLLLGNHDRRAAFRAAFPAHPVDPAGFVQQVVDLEDTRLVMLDTLDEAAPDRHSGWLCPARLAWLDAALAGARGRRVILFLHHPPMRTGFVGMDRIGLRDRDALLDRLTAQGNVVQIIAGHIHRTIFGAARGIPVAIFKSPGHQMPLRLEDEGSHLSVDEPGAYGLLLLGPEGIVVLSEDFTLPTQDPGSHG